MPLHEGKKRAIAARIGSILSDRQEIAPPIEDYSFESQLKRHEVRKRIEEQLVRIRDELFKGSGWRERYSANTMDDVVGSLIADLPEDADEEAISSQLDLLALGLDEYGIEQRVFIPISGLVLDVDVLRLGPFLLITMTDERLQRELTRMHAHFDDLVNVNPVSEYAAGQERKLAEGVLRSLYRPPELRQAVYAVYQYVGDFAVAYERAVEAIDSLVDLLRYCLHFLAPSVHGLTVGVEGQHYPGSRTIIVVPSDFSGWQMSSEQKRALYTLGLGTPHLREMRRRGVLELSSLLREPSPNEFQRTVLLALHWFADSTVHFSGANAFLSLTSCLEAFFTRGSDEPIARTIAEGVAFILGRDLAERKLVRSRVLDLYGLRSRKSHGQEQGIPEKRVNELREISSHVMEWMIRKLSDFSSKKDLDDWIDGQRLSSDRICDNIVWSNALLWSMAD